MQITAEAHVSVVVQLDENERVILADYDGRQVWVAEVNVLDNLAFASGTEVDRRGLATRRPRKLHRAIGLDELPPPVAEAIRKAYIAAVLELSPRIEA